MQVSRRQFFKICAGGMAGTTAAALGFAPATALAETRRYKLLRTRETRNTCTYCSVGCGLLMYSLGDGAEKRPKHPFSISKAIQIIRSTVVPLCPKGAGLVDFIHSESRLKFPEYRAPGSDKWQQISWDEAFDRIAKLMKEDRDANFIAQNDAGTTVNRWLTTGILCASASSNETGWPQRKNSPAPSGCWRWITRRVSDTDQR
ncbi:molybdopterin-dependent oxidoreductase [Klebsiella pneumoniae]|nr:molybdopterin-dependent oxidoreductase [Klebsiella pneumoniae]